MITHNGKQVTLAMRNRKAINLIARNGKAMFMEFSAISWAARAVILAEYGSVVWSDVRDYAKAHPQIVEFINQDPHLACSISPNSNKERWLVNEDYKAFIDTGYYWRYGSEIKIDIRSISNSGNWAFFGASNGASYNNGEVAVFWASNGYDVVTPSSNTVSAVTQCGKGTFLPNARYILELTKDKFIHNGVEQAVPMFNQYQGANTMYLFATNRKPTPWHGAFHLREAIIKHEGETKHHYYPCLYNGIAGMVDAISGTFHPNANTKGQFTIQITDKE